MGFIGFGARVILDNHQRYMREGESVFLRLKRAVDSVEEGQEFPQLGFHWSPTGAQADDTGFVDMKIDPPPTAHPLSMHFIGLNQTQLQFGAHQFTISHTFVKKRMEQRGFTNPYAVFRDPEVIGLFYNGRLFSIESIQPESYGGEIVYWDIVANAEETSAPASEEGEP